MNGMKLTAFVAAAFVTLGVAEVRANEVQEVEAARANARAGGPTNALDAWHLERWGCLSGSRSAFCQQLSHRGKVGYRVARRR